MQHGGLLQALQPARWRFEAGAPVEMNVGICIRLSAFAAGSRLTSSNTSSPMGCRAISSIWSAGEQARSRSAPATGDRGAAGGGFEAPRGRGQGIDMVQPVVEVELPEDGGAPMASCWLKLGRGPRPARAPSMQNGVCVGQQTLTGGSQADVVAMTANRLTPSCCSSWRIRKLTADWVQVDFQPPAKVPVLLTSMKVRSSSVSINRGTRRCRHRRLQSRHPHLHWRLRRCTDGARAWDPITFQVFEPHLGVGLLRLPGFDLFDKGTFTSSRGARLP